MTLKSSICIGFEDRKATPDKRDCEFYVSMNQTDNWHLFNNKSELIFSRGVNENDIEWGTRVRDYSKKALDEYNRLYLEYVLDKAENPEKYTPTYDEANWVHKLVYKGFEPNRSVDFYQNFYGVSKYSPDLKLINGDRFVIISLQGISMPRPLRDGDIELSESMSCKYIGLRKGEDVIYEDWSGNIPNDEIIKDFLL